MAQCIDLVFERRTADRFIADVSCTGRALRDQRIADDGVGTDRERFCINGETLGCRCTDIKRQQVGIRRHGRKLYGDFLPGLCVVVELIVESTLGLRCSGHRQGARTHKQHRDKTQAPTACLHVGPRLPRVCSITFQRHCTPLLIGRFRVCRVRSSRQRLDQTARCMCLSQIARDVAMRAGGRWPRQKT